MFCVMARGYSHEEPSYIFDPEGIMAVEGNLLGRTMDSLGTELFKRLRVEIHFIVKLAQAQIPSDLRVMHALQSFSITIS